MSAIAGCVGSSRHHAETATAQILHQLAPFGPEHQQFRSLGRACFGRALYRTLPEDDFDQQPLIGQGGGRCLFVADARIDNREELAASLRIDRAALERSSDADVLLAAWERWKLECFDRLLGDVALAVWQTDSGRLVLARSANSSKPLFWANGPGFVAFASMPQGLHALAQVPKRLNPNELVAIAAGLPYRTGETIFAGVHRVRPGHAVEWHEGRVTTKSLWDLDRVAFGSLVGKDYGEALRAELERAVGARLRRRRGPAASHLSSGRDSSAVTATAALSLREEREELIAVTGAPKSGFAAPAIRGRLTDESALASACAALHSNIRHFICRSEPVDLRAQIARLNETHFGPILNIRSIPWWTSVHERARAEGASVVLGGGSGNLSISAGGFRHLGDVLHRGLMPWLAAAAGRAGLSPSRWRSVANFSFGPMLPAAAYDAARRLAGRPPNRLVDVSWMRPDLREAARRLLAETSGDPRPPRSEYEFRRDLILRRDIADKQSLALWGLDLRDPTADRRLIELCMSLPPDQLISATSDRPAFEAAFADRLPARLLKNPHRGYQNADWLEHFDKATVEALFREYRKHQAVRDVIDFTYVDNALSRWPNEAEVHVLNALSIAAFVSLHFPG